MVDKLEHSKWVTQAKVAVQASIEVKEQIIHQDLSILVKIADVIAESIANGGCLFLCGNGGSLADAQHLAAELLIRLRPHVNRRALPALCLATDMSSVTACGNDYSFEEIFSRPLAALGNSKDVLLGITTSGKSANVIKAFIKAREMGITTVGFLGCGGGPILPYCDIPFIVPSNVTARIQECHITVGHIIMEFVEDMLQEKGYLSK